MKDIFKHISAPLNKIAPVVLMPGDPLRAKHMAETFLTGVELVSHQRNMFAFTGKYNGKLVTLMGSGMGNPSIGIYSYELYNYYSVQKIIRVGTCGAFSPDVKLLDIIIVDSIYSDSTYAKIMCDYQSNEIGASPSLVKQAVTSAKKLGLLYHQGKVYSSDVFYHANPAFYEHKELKKCLAIEMESLALFTNAWYLKKEALTLLTVSDLVYCSSSKTKKEISAVERQTKVTKMIELGLSLI